MFKARSKFPCRQHYKEVIVIIFVLINKPNKVYYFQLHVCLCHIWMDCTDSFKMWNLKKGIVCDFWGLSNGLMGRIKDQIYEGKKLSVFTSCFSLVTASCFFHAPEVPWKMAAWLVFAHIPCN